MCYLEYNLTIDHFSKVSHTVAVFSKSLIAYLKTILPKLRLSTDSMYSDPILVLTEISQGRSLYEDTKFTFSLKLITAAKSAYVNEGIIGIVRTYFDSTIIESDVSADLERKALVLKHGYMNMPVTKATLILKGFAFKDLKEETVRSIFASYGLVRDFNDLREDYDFMDINKRVQKLHKIFMKENPIDEMQNIDQRYRAIHAYLYADSKMKTEAIRQGSIKKGLFFHYLNNFSKYGFLGLIDKGEDHFRQSKIGFENEARIVIDKIQNKKRKESYYVEQLKYKKLKVNKYTITKIFKRWDVNNYNSKFKHNLERLEKPFNDKHVNNISPIKADIKYVDQNFIYRIAGIKRYGFHVDSPGLFVLWHYIEKTGIHSILDTMGLTYVEKGYSWFDHFLLNVGRIFYGIPSYSKTSECEEPSLPFFSHLVKLPCNDSFIDGLGSITEDQLFTLQKWFTQRMKSLGLIKGKKIAFDFHQIDLDVKFSGLKKLGKGPSSKKKLCVNAFRPHIAWDVETGNIIIAEFRKGSARGTTTIKRFIKEHLYESFKDVFEEVYIDSEYTGKDVWNFILDTENMGAKLIACIKRNNFVKLNIEKFLLENKETKSFWCYWDDKHVYSAKTFELKWEYVHAKDTVKEKRSLSLYCCVKKNINNGKLRCFASSDKAHGSKEILEAYSSRWAIETGIKDLIHSYFLHQCPGIIPHNVNVHFWIVTVCRHLFRMIEEDTNEFIKNSDGTTKTLSSMRKILFNQGSGRIHIKGDTIEIHFLNSFSVELTNKLKSFYQKIEKELANGLRILGGYKIKYCFKPPYGIEHRNRLLKVPLIAPAIAENAERP